MKRILFIATGGTIASSETVYGLKPALTPEELQAHVPELKDLCEIVTLQLLNIDSTNIQPEHWLLIAGTIEENYEKYDGFVIAHGTDTMAYTSAALTYLIQNPDKPIVLTGSQKPMEADGSDGHRNLLDSFHVACQKHMGGVYVVFCGKVIWGSRARKVRTKSMEAFESINYPDRATIENGKVEEIAKSKYREGNVRFFHQIACSVFLLKLIPGMNPDILDYIGSHYDAIVIESYGVGGIPFQEERNFYEKLENLANQNKIIVISTQVAYEGTDMDVYEVGVRALEQYEVLQSRDMTVEAVVTKLMWLMGQTKDREKIRQKFYRPVANDIGVNSEKSR